MSILRNTTFLICFSFCMLTLAEDFKKPASAIQETHKEAKASQKKINQLDDETKLFLQQYKTALNKTENLRIYNEQLSSYIEGQKKKFWKQEKKLKRLKTPARKLFPSC